MNSAAAAFDRLADSYDRRWSFALAGLAQRNAVWDALEPLLLPGMRAVDLGCGTGEDALRLQRAGLQVDAIDASPEMAARAIAKGVRARVMEIEEAAQLDGPYDVALSNFGALNCIDDLSIVGVTLRHLVRPGGYAALCLLNCFCLWETTYLALKRDWRKSVRRLRGVDQAAIGTTVRYHSVRRVREALGPAFELRQDRGIGIFTPPSFVLKLNENRMAAASRLDKKFAATLAGRSIADHRLLVFRRVN